MGLKSVLSCEAAAVIGNRQREEVELQVGSTDPGARADEAADLEMIGRAESAAGSQPAQSDERLRPRASGGIERDWLRARHLHIELEMVLQVFADAGAILHHRDPLDAQLLGR